MVMVGTAQPAIFGDFIVLFLVFGAGMWVGEESIESDPIDHYRPNKAATSAAMRPSATLNAVIDSLS